MTPVDDLGPSIAEPLTFSHRLLCYFLDKQVNSYTYTCIHTCATADTEAVRI